MSSGKALKSASCMVFSRPVLLPLPFIKYGKHQNVSKEQNRRRTKTYKKERPPITDWQSANSAKHFVAGPAPSCCVGSPCKKSNKGSKGSKTTRQDDRSVHSA
jgi:hypothetical protein